MEEESWGVREGPGLALATGQAPSPPSPQPTNPAHFRERRQGHGEYPGGGRALAGANRNGVSFKVGVRTGSVFFKVGAQLRTLPPAGVPLAPPRPAPRPSTAGGRPGGPSCPRRFAPERLCYDIRLY